MCVKFSTTFFDAIRLPRAGGWRPRWSQAALWTALALLGIAWTGCGKSEVLGDVSGKVMFQGEPVSEGLVLFTNPEKGVNAVAELQPGGSFRVETPNGFGLPPGTYQVAIAPPRVEFPIPADPTKPPPLPKEVRNIPTKYRYPQTSKLVLVVKEGDNHLDIDMSP